MSTLRLVFMGTAPLAATSLEALLRDADLRVMAAVTQPDRPKGRDLRPQPSAVKEVALRQQITVLQPEKAREEGLLAQLRQLNPDMIVVAAYGQILPSSILNLPRLGCLNVHTSLLPKHRGAAPIQWAILNGDPETGVTIMQMEPSLDTGPILTQESIPIREVDNAQTLHDTLAARGGALLVRTIHEYAEGRITPRPQPKDGVSYARKITKEDGLLDWDMPARTVWNRVRGLTPWPGTYTFLPTPEGPAMLKIWDARPEDGKGGAPGEIMQADRDGVLVACAEGWLRVLTLQREGGKRLAAREFLVGHRIQRGETFTTVRKARPGEGGTQRPEHSP